MKFFWLVLICVLDLFGSPGLRAQDRNLPPSQWVTDRVGFLNQDTRRTLNRELAQYQRQTGHQILVWIGNGTGGIPIEDWASQTFKAWKVGRKGLDDGLVLFIFAKDRKLRIEVGYGLESKMPDAAASRILREIITPKLRAGQQDAAVREGVTAILETIEGRPVQFQSPRRPSNSSAPWPFWAVVLFAIAIPFVLIFVGLVLAQTSRNHVTLGRRGWLGHGGAWFSGGSSGGWNDFFKGGGGLSGGGGASGDW